MVPVITDTAIESLNQSARQLQTHLTQTYGEQWDILDINEVLSGWLEVAIESLCEDASREAWSGRDSDFFRQRIMCKPSAQTLTQLRLEAERQPARQAA
jgi:hypothetical protein